MSDALLLRLEVVMKYATVVTFGLTGSWIVLIVAFSAELGSTGLSGGLFATLFFATLGALVGWGTLAGRREEALQVAARHTLPLHPRTSDVRIPLDGPFGSLGVSAVVSLAVATIFAVLTIVWAVLSWHWMFGDETTEPDAQYDITEMLEIGGLLLSFIVSGGLFGSISLWFIEPRMVVRLRAHRPNEGVWVNLSSPGLKAFVAAAGATRPLRPHSYLTVSADTLTVWHRNARSLEIAVEVPLANLSAEATEYGAGNNRTYGVRLHVTTAEGTSPIELAPRPRVIHRSARANELLAAVTPESPEAALQSVGDRKQDSRP